MGRRHTPEQVRAVWGPRPDPLTPEDRDQLFNALHAGRELADWERELRGRLK